MMNATYFNVSGIFDDINDNNSSNNSSIFDDNTTNAIFPNSTTASYDLDPTQTVIIPMTPGQKVFVASINAIIAIITTVVNVPVLVIWLVGSRREHTPSSAVVLNLFIFDLFVAGALYLRVGVVLSSRMASNQFACLAHFSFLIYGAIGMQLALTMAILDRYISIAHPFRYLEIVNYKVVIVAMLCTHLYVGCLSFVALIPSANNWDGASTNCTFNLVLTKAHIYTIICNLLGFMAISLSMYARVLMIARRHRRRIAAGAATITCAELSQTQSYFPRGESSVAHARNSTVTFPTLTHLLQRSVPCNEEGPLYGIDRRGCSTLGEQVEPNPDDDDSGNLERDIKASQGSLQLNAKNLSNDVYQAKPESTLINKENMEGKRLCWRFEGEELERKRLSLGNTSTEPAEFDKESVRCNSAQNSRNANQQSHSSSPNQLDDTPKRRTPYEKLEGVGAAFDTGRAMANLDRNSPWQQCTSSPISGNLLWLTNVPQSSPQHEHILNADKQLVCLSPLRLGLKPSKVPPIAASPTNTSHVAQDHSEKTVNNITRKDSDGSLSQRPESGSGLKPERSNDLLEAKEQHNKNFRIRELSLSPTALVAVPEAENAQLDFPRKNWMLQKDGSCKKSVNQSKSSKWLRRSKQHKEREQTLGRSSVVLNTHAESAGTKKSKLRQSGIANLVFCCCWFPFVVVQFYMLENPRVNLMPNNIASFLCMLNAILNPFIYVLGNTRMRKNMMNCLRGRIKLDSTLFRNAW